jgi:uncharacterized repeat protein (TIGR03803 family)
MALVLQIICYVYTMKKYYLLIFLFLCLGINRGEAQYTVLLNFNGERNPEGAFPDGSLTIAGNTMYGMAEYGGANNDGCIFSIDSNGNGYRDLFDFNGINGMAPYGALTLSGNRLYGMTSGGGVNMDGCVFSIDTNGSDFRDLVNFDNMIMPVGLEPWGTLTLSGSVLYGMTSGLIGGDGNIFSVDTDGSRYKDLLDFNGTNGRGPLGSLTISSGVLFGMTNGGGIYDDGVIFKIDTNGSGYKDLLDFDITNGANPEESLTLSGNVLYGTTAQGGADMDGCVFSIDTNGSNYKDLLDFNVTNGQYPLGSLLLAGAELYGYTNEGGTNNYGCIFTIDTVGSGYLDLFDFNGTNGYGPSYGSLILSGNVLYGMAENGGADSDGVIFRLKDTSIATEVNKINVDNCVKLYPNPNNGIFTIALSHPELVSGSLTMLEVYNVISEDIYDVTLKQVQGDNLINLTCQPNGVYFYRVISEMRPLVGEGKIIIER